MFTYGNATMKHRQCHIEMRAYSAKQKLGQTNKQRPRQRTANKQRRIQRHAGPLGHETSKRKKNGPENNIENEQAWSRLRRYAHEKPLKRLGVFPHLLLKNGFAESTF